MKGLIYLAFVFLFIGLVYAGCGCGSVQAAPEIPEKLDLQENEVSKKQNQFDSNSIDISSNIPIKIKSGEFEGENGEIIRIQESSNNKLQLRVKEVTVECDCELIQERVQNRDKLSVKLSNGKNTEIKIMPNVASEKALEVLRLHNCKSENNCSIELKEVGKNNETKLAYELKTERQSKVFGLFKKKMQVQAQINAENGEILKVKKPWWAFLASEPEEESL